MILSAAIFDLDGTILTDEDEYGKAFNKVLESLGVKTGTPAPHLEGIGVKENWPLLQSKYNFKTNKSYEELAHETQRAYLDQLGSVNVRAGFSDFIGDLRESNVKTALATSNEWWVVQEIFKKIDLETYFDVVTTAEEVSYNKPDPDIFILTAQKLGVEKEECLVFEDAVTGVTAAVRAGMRVVAVTDNDEEGRILSKEANLVIPDFSNITPETLASL